MHRATARQRVLQAHALITAAAGVVLIVRPEVIPATVGIQLAPDAFLLSYLLAGAEFGFSALSWLAGGSRDAMTLRLAMLACLVLHAASAALELRVWFARGAPVLLANVVARLVIGLALLWLLPRPEELGRAPSLPYNER